METHLYFDPEYLPKSRGEYVVWCDGMGTGRSLSRSLRIAAESIFRLHGAFSIAAKSIADVQCYAVMDGVYATCASRESMCEFLQLAFCELGRDFINRPGVDNMHMARAGLAFGPVIHGTDLNDKAFYGKRHGYEITHDEFKKSQLNNIRHQILLSPAMLLAYQVERLAPPFGVYVDDTAKCYPQLTNRDDDGFPNSLFQWWTKEPSISREIACHLYGQIQFYLEKSETHSVSMQYPKDRIQSHRELAEEYFGGLTKESGKIQPDAAPEE